MLSEVIEWEVRLRPRKEGNMSILIKGMQMPKNCTDCPLFESKYHYHGCHAVPQSFNDMDMWNFVGDRPSWCPLIEVPPHGDLIDRDEQIKRAWRLNLSTRELIEEMLKSAPTIIEAEESEVKNGLS